MTRNTRRIIFYIFVVIFIIITPPTILYSLGYSFDWQNKKIVQNGGFYLKSEPSDAKIYLNNKEKNSTPRLISGLTPRTYSIKISKEGFFAWQKNLEVFPGQVTEARNILLLPAKLDPEMASSSASGTIENFLANDQQKLNQQNADSIASSTAGWTLLNENIFYISEINYILYRRGLNSTSPEQISKMPFAAGQYQIFNNSDRQFLILSKTNDLFYFDRNQENFQLIAREIKGALMAGDNKKFIYWSDSEIWVYYVEDFLIQPYRQAGDKELITRFSEKISQTIFYPDNEHIAFVVGDQIKITELDGRDQRNTVDFLSTPSPRIYFDQNTNYFYYQSKNQIFRLKLE